MAQRTWVKAALDYKYPAVKNATLPENIGDIDTVLDDIVKMFNGAPNWGNPLTMCNVIPQANTAAIIASMLSQIFSTNILEENMRGTFIRLNLRAPACLPISLVGMPKKPAASLRMVAATVGSTAPNMG